ncbi:MAG: WD40 repeat domain-containing protein, partial [Pirellulales bacterium]|nr:WD40 repeat domain-containing protein [Pirellulales bacterium]
RRLIVAAAGLLFCFRLAVSAGGKRAAAQQRTAYEPVEFQRSPSLLPVELDETTVPFGNYVMGAVTCSSNGAWAAAGNHFGEVFVYDLGERTLQTSFQVETNSPVKKLAFVGNDSQIACLDVAGRLSVHSIQTGEQTQISVPDSTIVSMAFDARRDRLLTIDSRRQLEAWSAREGDFRLVRSLLADAGQPYTRMSISNRGGLLLLGSDNGWQIRRLPDLGKKLQASLPTGTITAMELSQDDSLFACGFEDGKIRVRDAQSGRMLYSWKQHPNQVTGLAFSQTSQTLISGCLRDRFRVWDLILGEPTNNRSLSLGEIHAMTLCPDGQSLLVGGNFPGVWLLKSRRPSVEVPAFWRPETWNRKAGFAIRLVPDQDLMLVVAKFGTPQRIDLETLESTPGTKISPVSDRLHFATISPAGTLSAHAYQSGAVHIYDVASGQLKSQYQLPSRADWLEFDPASQRLVMIANSPAKMAVLDAETGQVLVETSPQLLNLETVVWSPDGEHLLTSAQANRPEGFTGVLSKWSAQTAELIQELAWPTLVGHLAISPDGSRLVAGGYTGWVDVFDNELNPIQRFECGGHGGLHRFCMIDAKQLLVGTYQGSVLLMDVESGRELNRFEPLPPKMGMPIRGIDYHPRRRWIAVVGGYDGQQTMRLYSLDDAVKARN